MKSLHLFIILSTSILFSHLSISVLGQKVLDVHKTQEILQAQANLDKAYSEPGMLESERLELIRNSAIKLKEYGQPAMPPPAETPLRKLLESNYNKKQKEALKANNLVDKLNRSLLKDKSSFIKELHIEVVGDQVKFLIPWYTPVELSSDVVSTFFDWNIVEGATGGQRATARGLKEKILKIIEDKGSINRAEFERQYKLRSLNKLGKDRKNLYKLEEKMRKAYEYGESSTRTRRGYKNARLYDGDSYTIDPRLIGTWTYIAPMFNVRHQYNSDGTCQINVNTHQNNYKFSTSNGFVTYIDSDGIRKKLGYTVEGNQLYYGTKKSRRKAGHPLKKVF